MILTPEAKRLNIVFKDYGGSQESFARLLGVTQGSVSRMLKGEYPITLKVAKAVCYKLGYEPKWFIIGEGKKKGIGDKPGKIITDIAEFKTDLDIANARIDVAMARIKYVEDIVEKKV